MKRAVLLYTLSALLLFAFAPFAMADVITFNVTGTLAPDKGIASCSPVCTLGGNIVIDNTLGTVLSANVSVAGETPTEGPFNTYFPFLGSGGGIPGANTTLEIDDAASDGLRFYINTPTSASLVGYTGGPAIKILMTNIFADVTSAQRADWTGTGALTNSAVPEPSSLLLLASGGLGLANALRRKLRR
jgi:PEP-CTERM motif